jgi:hypothetical protein
MARAKAISITVTGNTAPLRKSLREADKELSAFGKAQAQWAQASALAYGVLGSAIGQFAADSVRAAIDDQKGQALLADQLQKTVGANEAAVKSAESYIETLMLSSNVADDELRPALAQLVRVTGDLGKAQRLLGVAVDVSAGSGKELSAVVSALSKAADGQTSALRRLGAGLSSAALNSGDLDVVLAELNTKFGGASAAAVNTTAGQIENLSLRFGELKEQIGTELLPVVERVSSELLGIADAIQAEDYVAAGTGATEAATGFFNWVSGIDLAKSALERLNPFAEDAEETIRATGDAANSSAAAFRRAEEAAGNLGDRYDEMRMKGDDYQKNVQDFVDSRAQDRYNDLVSEFEERQRKATEAQEADTKAKADAKKAYRDNARTLREILGSALEDSRQKLEDAKTAAQEFGDSFAYSFGVSLAGAYDQATGAEQDYEAALKDRADAYAELNIAKQGDDLQAYLKAVKEVEAAERGVTAAQAARVSPAAAFQKQIADAKTFGANLRTLLGDPYRLGQAGLQQLLDLGPSAGAQVTSDLLSGTAGFSVSDLNTSLSDLAGVQAGLSAGVTGALGGALTGAVSAAQSQVDALSSASIAAPGVGGGITVNISAGVGDPVAIGKQVSAVLGAYDNRSGKLLTTPPKKAKRKR